MFARAGVLAAQSTPLFSRKGKLLGMVSTHWKRNHTPSDHDLNLLDILARQGAELLEMHEGDIEAKSAGMNQGSTFTIRLPLASPVEAGAKLS
jgi:hypothetical protein